MAVTFDYASPRAAKARLGKLLGGKNRHAISAATTLLVIAGIGMLVAGSSIGWLLIGLSGWTLIIIVWQKGELEQIPPVQDGKNIDDLLSTKLLASLPKNTSPKELAETIGRTQDGLFYGVRFGLTPNFLTQIASSEQSDIQQIWDGAWQLKETLERDEITAGMLIYSLIKQFPQHEALLAHNHLELSDVIAGIEWQSRLDALVSHHKKSKRTGGIARDWSFGYTPLLSRFGANISEQISYGGLLNVELDAHQEVVRQMIDQFSARGRQNVALVGATGVGKTTVVQSFAESLLDASSKLSSDLKFRQVVMLDSASLISAAPGRGEIEDLIMKLFSEAYAAKNIILCLDDAQLFFEDGIGSVDISNVLLPIIEAGKLRLILTMDEQRFLKISQRNAALVNALNRINIAPAAKDETIAVMQNQLIITEHNHNVTYTYQSLEEAYRLSERYVHDLAMPGRAFKLLESASAFHEKGLVTINSVQQAIEKTMDVKVGVASESVEREKLLNLENLIHERMINQERAVQVVSDALRRARAGVRNQNRPIGTFLFFGPTGVGKTELAKALADIYFGGEDRMVRLDMNEYVLKEDVARLIADGADDPTSLTAQVRKQPFSVVLLDEIEKADSAVVTTLLQVLDEGILRDAKNREISFRDTIIIATSNAGAERIREYIDRGYRLDQFEEQLTNELIESKIFKPEFLNRFDEIVVFKPLNTAELLQVVDLVIANVNKTLSLQKVSVEVEQSAKELLVQKGYDPRLGARPIRRVVQRAVENTVAKQMLAQSVGPGSTVVITKEQVESILGSAEAANKIASELAQN